MEEIMEFLGEVVFLGLIFSLIFGLGFWVGYEGTYEFDNQISPTEITVNQQTGDTTFVYIMK